MWFSTKLFDLFKIAKDAHEDLRLEVATLKIERDTLQRDLLTTKANFAWITTRLNAVEQERAALLERVAGVKVLIPEVVQRPNGAAKSIQDMNTFGFEHIDDADARKMGIAHLLS